MVPPFRSAAVPAPSLGPSGPPVSPEPGRDRPTGHRAFRYRGTAGARAAGISRGQTSRNSDGCCFARTSAASRSQTNRASAGVRPPAGLAVIETAGKEIEPLETDGLVLAAKCGDRAQQHHRALVVADPEPIQRVDIRRAARADLHPDRIGPSEEADVAGLRGAGGPPSSVAEMSAGATPSDAALARSMSTASRGLGPRAGPYIGQAPVLRHPRDELFGQLRARGGDRAPRLRSRWGNRTARTRQPRRGPAPGCRPPAWRR